MGPPLGLYRAAPTRFAGVVREMGRALRLKADLKYIVDLPEYAKQDFRKKRGEDGDDGDLVPHLVWDWDCSVFRCV